MPLVSVVVVPTVLQLPDGSTRLSVMDLPEMGVVPALRVPERVNDWLRAGVVLLVLMVMVVGVRVLTVLDCLAAGLELEVVVVRLLTVLDCLAAGLELEVVAMRVVDAGFASTAGVALRLTAGLGLVAARVVDAGFASTTALALQNNNAQTTNTTATTITTLFSAYIFSHP